MCSKLLEMGNRENMGEVNEEEEKVRAADYVHSRF